MLLCAINSNQTIFAYNDKGADDKHYCFKIRELSTGKLLEILQYQDFYPLLEKKGNGSIKDEIDYSDAWKIIFSDDSNYFVATQFKDNGYVFIWQKYQNQTFQPFHCEIKYHSIRIERMAFNTDNTYLATANRNYNIFIFDLNRKELLRPPLTTFPQDCSALLFHPNGQCLIAGCNNGLIKIFHLGTNDLNELKGHAREINNLCFNSINNQLISSADGESVINIWNLDGYNLVDKRINTTSIKYLSFNEKHQQLRSFDTDLTIKYWNLNQQESYAYIFKTGFKYICSLIICLQRESVITGVDTGQIFEWDLSTGLLKFMPLKGHSSEVRTLIYNPQAQQLISRDSKDTIILWDLITRKQQYMLSNNIKTEIAFMDLHPSGKKLITCHGYLHYRKSKLNCQIVVWDTETGHQQSFFYDKKYQDILCFDVDLINSNRFVLALRANKIFFATLPIINEPRDIIRNDKPWVLENSNPSSVTDDQSIQDLENVIDCEELKSDLSSNEILSIKFTPDGKYVFAACLDSNIYQWDASSGRIVKILKGHTKGVFQLCFNPIHPSWLVSCSNDYSIRLWDIVLGTTIAVGLGYTSSVRKLEWISKGNYNELLTGDINGTLRRLEVSEESNGQKVFKLKWCSPKSSLSLFLEHANIAQAYAISNNTNALFKQKNVEGKRAENLNGHPSTVEEYMSYRSMK